MTERKKPYSRKKTYRHKNTGGSWIAPDHIHTFWVGQRVVRTGDRRNYVDEAIETAVVVELPNKKSPWLIVDNSNSSTRSQWSTGECMPVRVYLQRQRDRFRNLAKAWDSDLKRVNENGFLVTDD